MTTSTIYKKLKSELRQFIVETIHQVLDDPDFGMELSERAKKRLEQARKSRKRGIPASEIRRKYY